MEVTRNPPVSFCRKLVQTKHGACQRLLGVHLGGASRPFDLFGFLLFCLSHGLSNGNHLFPGFLLLATISLPRRLSLCVHWATEFEFEDTAKKNTEEMVKHHKESGWPTGRSRGRCLLRAAGMSVSMRNFFEELLDLERALHTRTPSDFHVFARPAVGCTLCLAIWLRHPFWEDDGTNYGPPLPRSHDHSARSGCIVFAASSGTKWRSQSLHPSQGVAWPCRPAAHHATDTLATSRHTHFQHVRVPPKETTTTYDLGLSMAQRVLDKRALVRRLPRCGSAPEVD